MEHTKLSKSEVEEIQKSHLSESSALSIVKIDYIMCAWILLFCTRNIFPLVGEIETYLFTNNYVDFVRNMSKRVITMYSLWINNVSILYIALLTPMAEIVVVTLSYFELFGVTLQYSPIEQNIFNSLSGSLDKRLEATLNHLIPSLVIQTYDYWVDWTTQLAKYVKDENIREVVRHLEEICPRRFYNIKNMFCFWGPWLRNWGPEEKWGFSVTKEEIQMIFRMLYHLQFPHHKSYPQHTYVLLPENLASYVKSFREGENPVEMNVNALHISIECGKKEKVHEVLTTTDININGMATLRAIRPFPLTPLMIACLSDLPQADDILEILLNHKKLHLNVRTQNNLTALKIAFKKVVEDKGRLGFLLRLLKDPRINVNAKMEDNRTILMMTIQEIVDEETRKEILAHLLKHPKIDVNVSEKSGSGYTALHHAVLRDQLETVKKLIEVSDISVNVRSKSQETPLILAASKNQANCTEIVKILVSHPKINLNAENTKHYTAFNFAQDLNNTHLVSFLSDNYKLDDLHSKSQLKRPMLQHVEKDLDEDGVHDLNKEVKDLSKEKYFAELRKLDEDKILIVSTPKVPKSVRCCWSCGVDDVKLYKCGGCRRAFYCSEPCIREDWQVHGTWCGKINRKRRNKKNSATDQPQ